MKNFDEWNSIKREIDLMGKRPPVLKGSIYWCSVVTNVGVEYDGKGTEFARPVLVLKNFSNEIIFGVPLTTKGKDGDWYFKLPHAVLGQGSYAVLNQAKIFDTKRFKNSIVQVSEKTVAIVLEKLFALLKT